MEGELWGLAVYPSSNMFVTASDDKTVRIWNIDTKVCIVCVCALCVCVCVCVCARAHCVCVVCACVHACMHV